MEDIEKGYTKKKYRRKIPKVGRSYSRHLNEDKTFDKSQDINDLVEDLYVEDDLEKGRGKDIKPRKRKGSGAPKIKTQAEKDQMRFGSDKALTTKKPKEKKVNTNTVKYHNEQAEQQLAVGNRKESSKHSSEARRLAGMSKSIDEMIDDVLEKGFESEIIEEDLLEKGTRTVTRQGVRYYAEGKHIGKRVGSVGRGRAGQLKAKQEERKKIKETKDPLLVNKEKREKIAQEKSAKKEAKTAERRSKIKEKTSTKVEAKPEKKGRGTPFGGLSADKLKIKGKNGWIKVSRYESHNPDKAIERAIRDGDTEKAEALKVLSSKKTEESRKESEKFKDGPGHEVNKKLYSSFLEEAKKDIAEAKQKFNDKKWMDGASEVSKNWAKETSKKPPHQKASESYKYFVNRALGSVYDPGAERKFKEITGSSVTSKEGYETLKQIYPAAAEKHSYNTWNSPESNSRREARKEKSKMKKSTIETEIDQIADQMAKSTQDPKTELIATIKELGAEGLRKSLPELSDDQRDLVKSILEEMSKGKQAVSMDANYDGDRKFITHDVMGTELEDGSDDEDEKLVLQAAASHNHQGDLSPEGRDDHVIKACDEEGKEILMKEKKDDKKPKKDGEECSMTKSLEDILILKNEVIESYENAGLDYDDVIVKSEMKKRLLKEEDQVEPKDQTTGGKAPRSKKESCPDIEEGKNAEETADEAVSKIGKMKKSLPAFDPQAKLRANTGGRNFHYSVNNYYNEALAKAQGIDTAEELSKATGDIAEETADDLNDIIEKGYDATMCDVAEEELQKSLVKGAFAQGSFSDEDMAEALNISVADYKELVGNKE